MARTFALIAPVQYVLHQVSCRNLMIPNAPKYYEMHWIISLGSNGVDWVHLLQKFWCDLVARISALIAPVQPVLHRVSSSNKILPNSPKYYETHQNMSLGSNGVGWFRSFRKIPMRLCGTNFCISCTSSVVLYRASCSNKTIQNASKHYETHQNMSLRPNRVDRVHSLRKILMGLRGKNFCINCTSSARFAPSFVQ